MDWHSDRVIFGFAVVAYGVSAAYSAILLRKGFRRNDWLNYLLLLVGFSLNTTAMLMRGLSLHHCPVRNLYEATAFAMWAFVGVYLVVGTWSRLRFLGAYAAPVLLGMGALALLPGLDRVPGPRPELQGPLVSLHATLMMLAYGAFGLSSVAAMMFLTQERNLKFHKLRALLSLLPPIEQIEAAVGRLLLAGFVLLSLGLAVGTWNLARLAHPQLYRSDPKIVWSVVVWCMYLGLILMRWRFAQAGRRFALGVVGSFVFVVLTFWGSSLLSPLHNL